MRSFTPAEYAALASLPAKPKAAPRKARRPGAGRHCEGLILASSAGAWAHLVHVMPGTKFLPGGKRIIVRGPVDFFGCLSGGRMVAVDAKECGDPARFPAGDVTHVPSHQRECLLRFGMRGALAGLLVLNTTSDSFHWCDWRRLVRPPPSILWSDLPDVGSAKVAIDWSRVAAAGEGD